MTNTIVADIRRLALNDQTLTNLSIAVGNLRTVSERAITTVDDLNALVTSNAPALSISGSNLVLFSQQLTNVGGDLTQLVATNTPTLNAAVKNIESSTVVLKTVLDELQAGKGLAGSLLKNEQLAATVSQIANNLSITSSNLNRLGLWGILWQRKPARTAPGPGAAQPLPAPKNPFD